VDIVYAGLAQHWLSPDALPFLELTAEQHLMVSETDSVAMLDEHSLPLPDGFGEGDSLPRKFIPLIDSVFGGADASSGADGSGVGKITRLGDILQRLKAPRAEHDEKTFAEHCLERMSRASPLALHATLQLVQLARRDRPRMATAQQMVFGSHGTHGPLVAALRRELRVQERLLCSRDAVVGLHARCLGRQTGPGDWSRRSITDVMSEEVDDLLREPLKDAADFALHERSEMPLSAHPRLRRYHPDFNPSTGLDHDPTWMADEVKRWSPDLFAAERRHLMKELLGDRDPSAFGLSRWTRVETPGL